VLTIIEKVIVLQNVDVFSEIPTEQLSYLAAIAEDVSFSPDEVIYKCDEPSDALYIVLEGKVRLYRESEEIAVAGAKEAFGTWALFDETPRVASARATEATRLLRIDREDFIDILSDHVQITESVLKSLVRNLRGLLDRVGKDVGPRATS
jgi:CRP-like cAMP-binding protein